MREIGGAVGIGAVSTVLVARSRDAFEIADPVARQAAAVDGFRAAFVVIVVLAALGAIVAGIAFPRRSEGPIVIEREREERVPAGGRVPVLVVVPSEDVDLARPARDRDGF